MRWIVILTVALGLGEVAFADVAEAQNAASAAIRDGDFDKATEVLAAALEEDPQNAYSHYLTALAWLGRDDGLDKVDHHLGEAEKLGAQAQPISLLRARSYARRGTVERALSEIESLADSGYGLLARVEGEDDFAPLHGNARFQNAVAKIRATRYPCEADARHRDFDFWVGEWDVFQNGAFAGVNQISSILGGCLVFEQWESASGTLGKSFNYFDPANDHWRQIWIADSGTIIEFTGEARDGGIFYTAETTNAATGAVTHHRFEFTQLPDGGVRQFWATSPDRSEWTTVWDGHYRRTDR